MISFLKKMFSKKEADFQHVEEVDNSLITELIPQDLVNINNSQTIKPNDISEIKKQSTQIKDNVSLLESIGFIKNFIESNNIEFKELISLLKKVVPYMKKEKSIEELEIVNYINKQTDNFQEKNNPLYQVDIADILNRVDNFYGLKYLQNILGDIEADNIKTGNHFNALILLSDYYLAANESDKAFQTIQRAAQLVTNEEDKFDYLSKQITIASKSSNICLNGHKQPEYLDYLNYEIAAFIFIIGTDLINFPLLFSFFQRKNICFTKGWGFEDTEDFQKALNDLKIEKHKKSFLDEIYTFTFNQFPINIGIPEKFLNEELFGKEWQGYLELMGDNWFEQLNTIKSHTFDISLVYVFSSGVVQKYYDMEN